MPTNGSKHSDINVNLYETEILVPPEGIIPFAVDQTQAQHLLNGWLTRQRRRPYSAMHGIYLSAWTYDVGGTIDWAGESVAYENTMRSRVTRTGQRPVYVDDAEPSPWAGGQVSAP